MPAAGWNNAGGTTGSRLTRHAGYSVPALPEPRGAKRPRRTGPVVAAVERFDWRPIRPLRRPAPARLRFPERPVRGGLRAFGGGPCVWCVARLVRAPGPRSIAAG